MNPFEERLSAAGQEGLVARGIDILQVNVGLRCNQSCAHCHLGAGPGRTEAMGREVMGQVLAAADACRPGLVDITGGAPELHPDLRGFIRALRVAGHTVQVRTNLTVLLEESAAGLPEFFRDLGVRLVGSMPCYLEENVERQRGPGVYARSIAAIRLLNGLGYGRVPDLPLNLAFNPGGPGLPPAQAGLEEAYRRQLRDRHGVEFTHLLTITNLPVGRFGAMLDRAGRRGEYQRRLREAFNPCTVAGLMCRTQVEIAWDGRIYDCDFNLALGRPVNHGTPNHVSRFDPGALATRRIVTGEHCFGCTAGAGSSCRGAISAA